MNLSLLAGSVLLFLGTTAMLTAIFRAMTHTWTYGLYEFWVLPTLSLVLILLGFAVLP